MQHQNLENLELAVTVAGWIARASADIDGRRCLLVGSFEPNAEAAVLALLALLDEVPYRLINSDHWQAAS